MYKSEISLGIIGVNHKLASVAVREQMAIDHEEQKEILQKFKAKYGSCGCLILSTCNRTELYISGELYYRNIQNAADYLNRLKKVSFFGQPGFSYFYKSWKAVNHFFRVISSLDSQIIGETQITNQLKSAYNLATESNTADELLHKMFNIGMRVEKYIRTNTYLTEGAVSISFAAVEMARKIFGNLINKTVVLIGAGETGELVAANFKEKEIKNILIVNRSYQKAVSLAKKFGAEAYPIYRLEEILWSADIVISATGSPQYIIDRDLVVKITEKRKYNPLFLIDIAVPRDIDPLCGELKGVFLYNMDDLFTIVEQNKINREKEIPKAENIINQYIKEFENWHESRPVNDTIKNLQYFFEDVRKSEYERLKKRFPQNTWNELNYITQSLMKKYLHHHIKTLKKNATDPADRERHISMVNEIYDLDNSIDGKNND